MKKNAISLLFIYLLFIAFLSPNAALGVIWSDDPEATFVAPASLQRVEKEAFAGVALQTVIFQEGFRCLGDDVFKGALKLKDAFIPSTTIYISDSAFPNSCELLIHGSAESYAQQWAKKNQVAFEIDYTHGIMLKSEGSFNLHHQEEDFLWLNLKPRNVIEGVLRAENVDCSMRPQDRPELYPIDYRFP